jgi:SAM-dependent methyltransferase
MDRERTQRSDETNDYAPNLDVALHEIEEGAHYSRWIVDRARPYLRGRVLDAGAGTGTFVDALLQHVDEVVALEPAPRFVATLKERFVDEPRVTVIAGDVEAPPPGLGAFDAIVCFNVLEHVRDDLLALRALRDLLTPKGALLLLVPAHPALTGPFDRAVGHLRRYTRARVAAAFAGSGLHVETMRHVNPIGALGWAVRIRLLRREEWPVTSFRVFDRLVPVVRVLDRLGLPFGLSLWVVGVRESG